MLSSSALRRPPCCPTLGQTAFRRRRFHHARGGQPMIIASSTKIRFVNSIHAHRLWIESSDRRIIGIATFPTRSLTTSTARATTTSQQQLIAPQQLVNDTSAPTPEDRTTTFTSYSTTNPHLLLTPKDLLIEVFQKNGIQNAGEYFHVNELKHRSKTWYTATFTDPVTNEIFYSGLERRTFFNSKKRRHNSVRSKMKAMDGKVYCVDPALAEHAAAARAIDCYIFREGGRSSAFVETQQLLCLESPYHNMIEAANNSQTGIEDDDNHHHHHHHHHTTSHRNQLLISQAVTFIPQRLLTPCKLFHTKFGLNNYDSTKNMKTHRKYHEGELWFTATFTDPMTNELFSSGLVVSEVNVKETDTALSLRRARAVYVDGSVYYREASLAQQAAAARAIDCYVYREESAVIGGGRTTTADAIRLCIEHAYLISSDEKIPPIDYDAILSRRNSMLTSGDVVFQIESSYDGEVPLAKAAIDNDALSTNSDVPYEEGTSDDALPALPVSLADTSTEIKQLHNLSTMGRILEIWTDTAASSNTSSDDELYNESNLNSEYNDSASAKIKSILDWYERVICEPRTKAELSAVTCRKLLVSLGKANMEQYRREDESQIVRVEKEARQILGKINTLSDSSYLDADLLNAYLHCLDRCDPERSAVYAEELLQCMREQSQHKSLNRISLPRPNVETYNAVMDLWALMDGPECQNGVNRIYSLLEAAALSGEEFSPRPNSTTFNTIIAVNSRKDGQFSFEQAKLWFLKIREVSESICGEEKFTPDADIFTAALKAQSMCFADGGVNPQYSISWLSYGNPYAGGFKSVDEQSRREATDIAPWLLYAEDMGVTPNTEMYEAVIRAWTNTGTRDGLIMAEDWAKRAVSSGSPIRLETFHPIIAAWALCQFDRAPARVKEWIHQLNGLSTTHPHLKPDLSMFSALIVAWVNVQTGIIAKTNQAKKSSPSPGGRLNGTSVDSSHQSSDGGKVSQDVDMVFVAAQNCMEELKTVLTEGSKPKNSQDAEALKSMIGNTIKTWGCASRFALLHPTTSSASRDASHGVQEMLKIAKSVKDKAGFDDDNKNDLDDDDEQAYFNFQLIGQSYAEIISQLHQIDSALESTAKKKEDDTSSSFTFFSKEIAHVERMLNEFDTYSKNLSPRGNYSSESTALRHRLYKEILTGCSKLTSPSDYGHGIRLCKLIMDQLSWQEANCNYDDSGKYINGRNRPHVTDLYADMALLTGTFVPIPQERAYVLTTIWQNAKPFFRQKLDRSTHRSTYYRNSYATVNQSRLIGSMRMAMGDWEGMEKFMRNFDEWRSFPTRRARGNTWLAFVQDLLKNSA